jgi:hypothetical protein
LRWEISSIPMRRRPSRRSTPCPASSATRLTIRPTCAMRPAATRGRRSGGVDRQPRGGVLEPASEPRTVPGPRGGGDHQTVLAAAHPGRVGLQQRLHGPKVQRPPAPSTLALIKAGAAPAADPYSAAGAPVPVTPTPRSSRLARRSGPLPRRCARRQAAVPIPFPAARRFALLRSRPSTPNDFRLGGCMPFPARSSAR